MPTFIKPGFWNLKRKQLSGELNLDKLIQENIANITTTTTTTAAPLYKTYKALVTFNGANAPLVTILENTLGTVTVTYVQTGIIRFDSAALFTTNKTVTLTEYQGSGFNFVQSSLATLSDSIVQLANSKAGANFSIGELNPSNFGKILCEIQVYN